MEAGGPQAEAFERQMDRREKGIGHMMGGAAFRRAETVQLLDGRRRFFARRQCASQFSRFSMDFHCRMGGHLARL